MGRFIFTLKSLNCDGWRGPALLAACAVLLVPALLGPPVLDALRYERPAIAAGQWWRLLSAHLVHLGLEHAALNAAGLALLWMLFLREYTPWRWLAILLGATAALDAGLWFRDVQVEWYVGASGVLHGVLAAGAFSRLRQAERDGWILAALLLVKLAYEQARGAMPFSAGLGTVIVNAHLYGALGGLAVAVLLAIIAAPRRKEPA